MSLWVIFFAFVALGAGKLIVMRMTKTWTRVWVDPRRLSLPKVCPVCLSPDADSLTYEESPKRQTANYIVARKLEWWSSEIGYCKSCIKKVTRMEHVGTVCGVVFALVIFIIAPPEEASFGIICYFLFAYPVWEVISTIPKGIIYSSSGATSLLVKVRSSAYSNALKVMNPGSR
jgi:hypothetical protein